MAGERRKVRPIAHTRSEAPAAATIASPSATVGASGFSQSTCLPAASSPSTTSRCSELATATLTTSTSDASATACQLVSARAYPNRRAVSTANGSYASAIATSRTSGSPGPYTVEACRYALACARPTMPAPTTATRRARRPSGAVNAATPSCAPRRAPG